MKGKIFFSLVVLGTSSIALANGAVPITSAAATPDYFSGFVVGLDGSVQHLHGNVQEADNYRFGVIDTADSMTAQINGNVKTINPLINTDIGSVALGGGIFAGFGKVFNSEYYLGGEAYVRYAHNSPNATTNSDLNYEINSQTPSVTFTFFGQQNTSINIDSNWAYGASLKLGYLVSPKTMIYLLAGVEYAKFQVDVSHSLTNFTGLSSVSSEYITLPEWSTNYSFDQKKWAFVPGVGIETMLTDKLSLKAEYTYADFGEWHSHANTSTDNLEATIHNREVIDEVVTVPVQLGSDDKVDIKRGLFTLGLAYHFNGI